MECASGGDLRHRVDSQARLEPRQYFPEHLISYWAAQLAAALNYLHERSWVHRDIKSANVFLTLTEEVKLGDFGHAKHIAGETERSVAGTPESMSPEVILGKEYGARTDVWSLGVVLYEAAMLHRPFDGNTIRELLGAIVSGNYAPIVRKDCKDYRYLVNQLLTVDVQHRPTMQEVFSFPTIQKQLRMAAEGKTLSQRPQERPILAIATEEQKFGKSVRVKERAPAPTREKSLLLAETNELPSHYDPRSAHQMSIPLGLFDT